MLTHGDISGMSSGRHQSSRSRKNKIEAESDRAHHDNDDQGHNSAAIVRACMGQLRPAFICTVEK
jgi:hypothetical protein